MTKSNGIKSLKQAAKLLNKHAPDGESLAYINPQEARLLKAHGGSGIQTLSTVPSYASIFGWDVPFTGNKDWGEIATSVGDWLGYGGDDGGGKLVKDLASLGGGYLGYKEAKELTDWEKEQYEKQLNEEALNKILFGQQTDSGKQLLTPTNVPETIDDVSVFSEATGIPTMTTTAAHGGRIGFNSGSGKTYDDWLKYRIKEIAAQRIPVPFELWKKGEIEMAQGGRIGYQEGTHPLDGVAMEIFGDTFENLNPLQQIVVSQSQNKADLKPNIQIPSDSTVNTGDPYSSNIWEGWKAAQGGRIGYNLGGIGAMDPRMGYAQGMGPHWDVPTFSEGVPQEFPSNELGATTGNFTNEMPTSEMIENMYWDVPIDHYDIESIGGKTSYTLAEATQLAEQIFGTQNMLEYLTPNQINKAKKDFIAKIMSQSKAQGGRIGAQKGGIMPLLDMGGMEKDYRQDGGFVPIGRREKADDVPARLSKNEFVFTADAVRAAGGGDIDQGAQRMYNVMKNLEAGGEISEQSQGKA
jgi:hypothetical protein